MESSEQLGKYTLVRHLATGGMAEIYLAEQAGPGGFNKELVIKRILPHMAQDDDFVRMFLDEARLVAQLSHPKIAQIYDLGEIDGQYFIAMEFVDGLDLADVLEGCRSRGEHVPIPVAIKITIDLLEALDYAHDFTDREGNPYGLVHRDISPHNVLLSNDGIVKLVDFGVAKAQQNKAKTQTGAVKGKFAYMAPEQIQSQDLDRRADLFATGILLYELLTEQKPFGDELTAVTSILTQPHPDPRTIRPEIPEALVDVIDRALAKQREARYADAHAMVRDLEAIARSSSEYVGDRELAAFIRNLRGLPTTRHSSQGELSATVTPPHGARVTPVEEGLPATQAGTRVPAPAGDVTGAAPATQPAPHPQQQHPNTASHAAPQTGPQEAFAPTAELNSLTSQPPLPAEDEGVSGGVIALFVILLLAIVGAAGGAFFLLVGGDDDVKDPATGETTVVAEQTTPTNAPESGDPNLLRHAGGQPVQITGRPKGEIFFEGKLVGTTPIFTSLKPGDYTIEYRSEKGNVTREFTVGEGMTSVRFQP